MRLPGQSLHSSSAGLRGDSYYSSAIALWHTRAAQAASNRWCGDTREIDAVGSTLQGLWRQLSCRAEVGHANDTSQLVDHTGLGDERHNAHLLATAWAFERLHVEEEAFSCPMCVPLPARQATRRRPNCLHRCNNVSSTDCRGWKIRGSREPSPSTSQRGPTTTFFPAGGESPR